MLAVQHHPIVQDCRYGLNSDSASSYFDMPSQNDVAHCIDAQNFAATSKNPRRLSFDSRDTEPRSLEQDSANRSEYCIRHSDISYRMHSTGYETKAQFREPVIVPPSCPSAVLWDGSATGPSVLLRHGSGCSFTVVPSLMKSLESISNDCSVPAAWGDIFLDNDRTTQKAPSTCRESQFVVKESSSMSHNPYHSYCRIVFLQSSNEIHGDVSRLIPQHVYASAIMDLASRMCSAKAPSESLSVFIMLAHLPCPSIPLELSLCSISSSFQASLSPIKAMAVLDPSSLLVQLTASEAPSPRLGWLTIDRRRRLIPVAAGDPTIHQFPVVGVFVSGVHSLQSPIVSAACTWFNSCCNVNRSLIPSDGSFLLLHSTNASNQPQLVHSLYEAHPNFSKQPFSIRCSEFITCHGSAVTLRPKLVVPESDHPFVLATDQLGQDLSTVSNEFFSGFHDISTLHLPSFTDDNTVNDRNLVTPFPEPALSPQPSVYPQYQAVTSSLDNPSLVFRKRVPQPFQTNGVPASLESNSLGLVQTIIQQQNTISMLQNEKEQLLSRIMELEALVLGRQTPRAYSSAITSSMDTIAPGTSTRATNLVTQNGCNEEICIGEPAAAQTVVAVSGMSYGSCSLPHFLGSNDLLDPHSTEAKRLSSQTSSSVTSSKSSHEIQQKRNFGDSATHSRVVALAPEFNSFTVSHSQAQTLISASSKTDDRDQKSSSPTDELVMQCQHHFETPSSPAADSLSHVANDSISFTVPKISYTPLSDDDDSALFTSYPASAAYCSGDSSGSSHS
jgi:hypothetical protein